MTDARMRVLHVIGPLSPGGAQTQLLGLVRAGHGALWDATVVGTDGGAFAPRFEELPCDVTVLRRIGSPGLLRLRRVRQIARRGRFDVIHGNLWQSNVACRTAVVGRRDRPAVVISERNVEASRASVQRRIDAALAPVTDAYVGNTEAVCDFIRRVHPVTDQEVVHIANAVDRDVFHPRRGARAEGPLRVGSAGRLDVEKGFDVLVEAVRLLAADRPVELEVVGEGPERAALESRAAGLPVRLPGLRRPGSEMADFLRSLDVFVLPSTFREGRPNVVLEALAVGLPVVATAIDGMDEVLRGPTLVPPGDAAALARAIGEAADDPDGWRARSEPVPIPGFDDLARSYLEVFQRAVERAARTGGRELSGAPPRR